MSRSKIIKPSTPGIPAGPLESTPHIQGKRSKPRRSIAAVIRPVPTGSELEGSLRIDPATEDSTDLGESVHESPQKHPHQRTHDLDDYVAWLKEKIDRARLRATAEDVLNTSESNAETTARPKLVLKPHLPEPLPDPEIVLVDKDAVIEEEIIAHQMKLATQQSGSAMADLAAGDAIALDDLGSVITTLDVDQAITGVDGTVLTSQSSDAELAKKISDAIDTARAAVALRSKPEHSSVTISRVDNAHSTEAVLDPHLESFEEPSAEATQLPQTRLSSEEAETFISTVSKAIASVLTEKPEATFERNVRDLFASELHNETMRGLGIHKPAMVKLPTNETPVLAEEVIEQPTSIGRPVEVQQVTEAVIRDARKNIPTTVAAWDVEDFRWPTVSNRMIVSGGEAMEGLYSATSGMTTTAAQRIAVCGLARGAGTTSIAVSLARWAAACGNTVLLVDADISQPELSRQVGLAPNLTWIKAGTESLPVAEVIVRAQKSNLCIMPLAPLASRAAWPRYIYDHLGELTAKVQEHFDLILFDVGPATQLMDELSQASLLADGTLFVHDGVDSPKFRKMKNNLASYGLKKMVVTQNRVRHRPASTNVA